MLSRSNAGEILSKYGGKYRWVNHCVAVAALADFMAVITSDIGHTPEDVLAAYSVI